MQQLDIFNDSRDQQLRNDLIAAVAACDLAAAQHAYQALAAEYPNDAALAPAADLMTALASATDEAFANLAQALAAGAQLHGVLASDAVELLGREGSIGWLRAQWRQIAKRAAELPFDARQPEGHAAALWLQGAAWTQASDAVERIDSWRRIPQPLAWMLLARCQRAGVEKAWPLLAELCWLAPERAGQLLLTLPDARLRKQLQRFDVDCDEADTQLPSPGDGAARWAWLPAWLLVDQPLLAEPLAGAQPTRHDAPERALLLVQSLLRLERQGRHADVVAHRRELLGLSAWLFSIYMKTR